MSRITGSKSLLIGVCSLILTSCSEVRLIYAFAVQSTAATQPAGGNALSNESTDLTNPLTQPLVPTDITGLNDSGASQGSTTNGGQANVRTGNGGNTATDTTKEQPSSILSSSAPAQPATTPSAPLSLTGVKMFFANPSFSLLSKQGDTMQLYLVMSDAQGNPIDPSKVKVVYESSDPKSISVDANGLVKSLQPSGNVTITAKLVDNSAVTTSLQIGMGSSGDSPAPPAPADPNAFDGVQGIIDFS